MRDDICTIPVSEVFEENCGCPICRMKQTIEKHIVDYIMGAAMMEPDIRIETNKAGFCRNHLDEMLSHKGRLSLALMLETHLDTLYDDIFKRKLFNTAKSKAGKVKRVSETCFICDKIEWGMERMIATLFSCYETQADFRKLFEEQTEFCLPHFELLVSSFNKKDMPKHGDEFLKTLSDIIGKYISGLKSDVHNYTKIYSYHNNKDDCDWERSKNSVERAVAFLSGRINE